MNVNGEVDTKCVVSESVTVNGCVDPVRHKSEDEMQHMQEVADDLVAKLMEDEDKPPAAEKWYYRDPQGEVQGKWEK